MTEKGSLMLRVFAVVLAIIASVSLVDRTSAQSGVVQITNASGNAIDVVAIEGESQNLLVTMAPGESLGVPAAPGTALGFSAGGQWFGEGYRVTGAPNESVTVPYSAATAATASQPEAVPQESPDVTAARQRFQGPGSVQVQFSNPTADDIAATVSDETGQGIDLFVIPAQQTVMQPVLPQTQLFFFPGTSTAPIGQPYIVTAEAAQALMLPYEPLPPPEAVPQASPDVSAARQRFQGPGSVQVQFSNPTADDVAAVVSDETGQGVDLFVIPAQQTVMQPVLPETQLFFFPRTSIEPIGQPYVVTAEAAQALMLPYQPLPPAEVPGQASDLLPPAESGVAIEIANPTADDIAVVSKEGADLFTVRAQQTETHRVPPGTEIWFFPGQGETPVGSPYVVAETENQAITLPYDPTAALLQLHQGPGSARAYISNSLKQPIAAAVTDATGGRVDLFEIPAERPFFDTRFQPGTTVWFYPVGSPDPVGDPAVIRPDQPNEQQIIVVPYKTPSDVQLSMSGPGSIELRFGNLSSNEIVVATTDAENRRADLDTVEGNALGIIRALPGATLWFYTAGSDTPDEYPYTVPDSPPSMIDLPYRPRTAAAEQFLGTGTEITFNNPGNIPATVALKDAAGNPVELLVVQDGQTAKEQIPPRTMLWFYKSGMTEPYERPRPYFVPDAPATVQLPYRPTDDEIARMVGVDLNKITQEIINKVVADRLDSSKAKVCWKDSYTRGVGTVPRNCPPGQEEATAGLCYDKCRPGYTGFVTMCVPGCPPGYRDDGLYCFKPPPYKRDEYPISAGEFFSFSWVTGNGLQGARDRCRRDHGNNCVTANGGTIVYETCKAGYEQAPIITNLCTPSCPPNTTDIGISCQKNTYDRGVGRLMSCDSTKEYDAGLCYDNCRPGYTGVGFVCWAACPTGWLNCGASCAKSKDDCALALTDQITSPFIAAGSIALTALTAGAGSAAVSSAKTAAQTGAQVAAKTASKAAARTSLKAAVRAALKSSTAQAIKTVARKTAVELAIDTYVGATITTWVWTGFEIAGNVGQQDAIKDLKADVGEAVQKRMGDLVTDGQIEAVVDTAMAAAEAQAPAGSDFPWESLDPTGIADIVRSYNLPLCSDVK